MKQSMQVVAMVAFLGCFAIVVIAAGSGKARAQEDQGRMEEWLPPRGKETSQYEYSYSR
jgi:hypothetical protein